MNTEDQLVVARGGGGERGDDEMVKGNQRYKLSVINEQGM